MGVRETLVRAREAFLNGEHFLCGVFDLYDALTWAAGDDVASLDPAVRLLDGFTPHPWTFQMFIDGAEWITVDGVDACVYHYDRKPEEIAAIFGKAILRAARLEAA